MAEQQTQRKRLIVIQPALHKYRQELFRELAQRFDVFLTAEDKGTVDALRECLSFFPSRMKHLRPLPFFWQSPLSILGQIRRGDTVLLNSNPRFLSGFWIYLIAKIRGAHIVFWNHGHTGSSPHWRSRIRYLWERCADRNLLYYEDEIPYAEQMGIKRKRLYAANNTINTTLVAAAMEAIEPAELEQFRNAHGLNGKKIILFIGRVTAKAGFPLLLESFRLACQKDPQLLLVIIGAGEQAREEYPLLRNPALKDKVIIAGELFEEAELAPWLLSADIFFYPGSVGLSLVHAFAYGLPAVIHDDKHTHMPEVALFAEGVNGLSFKDGSAADAADKLLTLASDDTRRQAMGASAKALVFAQYRIEQMAERIGQAVTFSD